MVPVHQGLFPPEIPTLSLLTGVPEWQVIGEPKDTQPVRYYDQGWFSYYQGCPSRLSPYLIISSRLVAKAHGCNLFPLQARIIGVSMENAR